MALPEEFIKTLAKYYQEFLSSDLKKFIQIWLNVWLIIKRNSLEILKLQWDVLNVMKLKLNSNEIN